MIIKRLKYLNCNPYSEGTLSWNIWIDICCSVDDKNVTTLDNLCKENNLSPEYYDFSELLNDELIEIED